MYSKKIVVGPFQCNCHVLACDETGETLVIDPGDEPQKILQVLKTEKTSFGIPLKVKALFHTHAHLDHIGGTRGVYEGLTTEKPKLMLHKGDDPLYKSLKVQGEMFGFEYQDPISVSHFIEHEEVINLGKLKFTVVHTPGHSPGSVCLRLHEDSVAQSQEKVFSGDTLFQSSVGRTDLWGGNMDTLVKSIKERILTLDGDTCVCPGHGADTRVGIEKRENPFL
jgi:glyoxylase-like metal-dependent hydrolase (beta-lactamase superfamily II)